MNSAYGIMGEALSIMQNKCKRIQENMFGYDFDELMKDAVKHKQYLQLNTLGLLSEIFEVKQELPWKDWKDYELSLTKTRERVVAELVDIFHFAFNIAILYNIDPYNIAQAFIDKNSIVMQRQTDTMPDRENSIKWTDNV